MKKLISTLLLSLFFSLFSFSQDYVVQIAAFDTKVPLDYFKDLSGIYHIEDHNNIHRYYISGFSGQSAAQETAKKAKGLGYNASVIDMDEIRRICSQSCGAPEIPGPGKIQSIFFDFDQSFLRGESKRQLDQLRLILAQNATYTVELSAHTDAKGSLEYNTALSMRRAVSAKEYLLTKVISADRIKVSTFGENAPIAKNELTSGIDTPAGRQFNRRVQLIVHNSSGAIEPVVAEIYVPKTLKQD
ncbi:MAG: outer membrane protein OmpA-like peptidoglycan-associated protein [Saprospiraceae bacterium]|jgi:outer membrane protein OmpA-like peptidoglycan-associated protein